MAKDKVKTGGAKYTSADIDTLRFPESLRANTGMYIGGADGYARWVTVKELLDNALDEFLAGRNTEVDLYLTKENEVWVVDQGGGIPQGVKKHFAIINGKNIEVRTPTMQAVFGELHTSGKFRDDAYKVSIGTHGVGSKATNATAAYFRVWTKFNGSWYHIAFKEGKLVTAPKEVGSPPRLPDGQKAKRGTIIQFLHDVKVFPDLKKEKGPAFPLEHAHNWGRVMSFINAGFRVTLHPPKGKPETFYSKNGAKDYVKERLEKLKAEAEPILLNFQSSLADVVVSFSSYADCELRGFVNGSFTKDGGKHVDAVTGAVYKALLTTDKKAAKLQEKAKEKIKKAKTTAAKKKLKAKLKDDLFSENDVKEGMIGLVNAKLHKPIFNSQDKVKLVDDRMGPDFEAALVAEFTKFFKENKALATRLREKASRLSELKSKFTASKEAASSLSAIRKQGISSKYAAPSKSVKAADCELLVVEGDSAAGGVREQRMPHQGLTPLKGKIINAMRSTADEVLASEQALTVLAALAFDPKAKDPLLKLAYGRIILLADPDPDGHHINSLLLSLLYRFIPEMFEHGMVYLADIPPFYAHVKERIFLGDTLREVQKQLAAAKMPKSTHIERIKGWGQVDSSVLYLLALDVNTRRLIKVKPLQKADEVTFMKVMGEDAAYRRQMLGLSISDDEEGDDEKPKKAAKKPKAKKAKE